MDRGDTVGASSGAMPAFELASSPPEGSGDEADETRSLSHNTEQLVFQKPIFSCSRSYVTSVFCTTIPAHKIIVLRFKTCHSSIYTSNNIVKQAEAVPPKRVVDSGPFEKIPRQYAPCTFKCCKSENKNQ